MQKTQHEIQVVLVLPLEVLSQTVLRLLGFRFFQDKVHIKLFKEVIEEKIFEDLALNFGRQLTQYFLVLLGGDGVIFVVGPIVLEILLETRHHVGWERLVFVEILEDEEELRQFFLVFVGRSDVLHLKKDGDQLGHDICKAGNSRNQNKSHNEALDLALRVEIAKTHR